MKYADLIGKMTLQEKAGLCSGLDYWHTKPVERLGVPSIMLSDGPHGLRRHPGKVKGKNKRMPLPATCFPLACLSACSWDTALLREVGAAIGEEALAQQVSVVLGPGVNIKRSPLCGRNFEYFSEDPLLSGCIGAAWVQGVQSKGVGACVKHFAANSQEAYRMTSDSVVDMRALREIYLPAFETVVRRAQPWSVMSAYNKLNGAYCTENSWLLTDVLRRDWGFQGFVVCDWGAENDRVCGLRAGNDLEMPASSGIGDGKIVQAVQNGTLDESVLDTCVDRVLDFVFHAEDTRRAYDGRPFDRQAHHALARRAAAQSMVLLKNEGAVLPLQPGANVAVIGAMAETPRYQGAGSSQVNPTQVDSFLQIAEKEDLHITYAPGYDRTKDVPDDALLKQAQTAAAAADVVLLFIGLPEAYEAEAQDRKSMALPPAHNALVEAVCSVHENVVVVLSGGAPVEMPWLGRVKGLLNASLAGQAGAGAIADIVTGRVNPSGKLAETYPLSAADVPCAETFGAPVAPLYKESVFVGYRYYDTVGAAVCFPFGFGLSYTTFAYSDLQLCFLPDDAAAEVSFTLENTGSRAGAEVAQVYLHAKSSAVFRPVHALCGFEKVFLQSGEKRRVTLRLDRRAFSYYNVEEKKWCAESGDWTVEVGASSRDIRLTGAITAEFAGTRPNAPDYRKTAPLYYTGRVSHVPDEQFAAVYGRALPPQTRDKSAPLDLNSTISDGRDVPAVRVLKKVITLAVSAASPNPAQAEVAVHSVMSIPIRLLISMSQGVISPPIAQAMVEILDGRGVARPLFKILGGLAKTIRYLLKLLNTVS